MTGSPRLGCWIALLVIPVWVNASGADDSKANARARQAIEKLGGKVTCVVVEVRLGGTKVTDDDLKHLATLKDLKWLDLGQTRVTDAGLKHLGSLKKLEMLSLLDTPVTNAGLKELAGLRSLKFLYLDNTGVTDTGLRQLTTLTELKDLSLRGTKVSDAGVAFLKKALPHLTIQR